MNAKAKGFVELFVPDLSRKEIETYIKKYGRNAPVYSAACDYCDRVFTVAARSVLRQHIVCHRPLPDDPRYKAQPACPACFQKPEIFQQLMGLPPATIVEPVAKKEVIRPQRPQEKRRPVLSESNKHLIRRKSPNMQRAEGKLCTLHIVEPGDGVQVVTGWVLSWNYYTVTIMDDPSFRQYAYLSRLDDSAATIYAAHNARTFLNQNVVRTGDQAPWFREEKPRTPFVSDLLDALYNAGTALTDFLVQADETESVVAVDPLAEDTDGNQTSTPSLGQEEVG